MKKTIKTILHFPHVSLKVPKYFYEGLKISRYEFNCYNLTMSDVGVDTLFSHLDFIKIIPKYSRLFCDVERFKDDKLETMAKYGQGVIYTHTYDGINFHNHDSEYVKKVLAYYDKYHKMFDKIVASYLDKCDILLILDIHSFSNKQASHLVSGEYPDICIGIEKDYFDQEILDKIILSIKNKGYSYAINFPYKGSIVPNIIYNNKHSIKTRVVSFMIEVNKRIYL